MAAEATLTLTLKKSAELPQFRKDLFVYVDEVDFKGLKPFFSDNFCLYFAHYVLEGIDQAVGFVGAFDKQLPKYEHIMKTIFGGDIVTIFYGVFKVWLEDGTVVETPFYDKIEVDPSTGKITTMYLLKCPANEMRSRWYKGEENSKKITI
jgi:hypothetical protein